MSISECARIQGFCYHKPKWPTKFARRHALLGNTMSINVLQRLMIHIFSALGHTINDPWKDQTAIKHLMNDAKADIIQSRSLITYHFGRQCAASIRQKTLATTPSHTEISIEETDITNTGSSAHTTGIRLLTPSTQRHTQLTENTNDRSRITFFFRPSNHLDITITKSPHTVTTTTAEGCVALPPSLHSRSLPPPVPHLPIPIPMSTVHPPVPCSPRRDESGHVQVSSGTPSHRAQNEPTDSRSEADQDEVADNAATCVTSDSAASPDLAYLNDSCPSPSTSLALSDHSSILSVSSSDEFEQVPTSTLHQLRCESIEVMPFHILSGEGDEILASHTHSPIIWQRYPEDPNEFCQSERFPRDLRVNAGPKAIEDNSDSTHSAASEAKEIHSGENRVTTHGFVYTTPTDHDSDQTEARRRVRSRRGEVRNHVHSVRVGTPAPSNDRTLAVIATGLESQTDRHDQKSYKQHCVLFTTRAQLNDPANTIIIPPEIFCRRFVSYRIQITNHPTQREDPPHTLPFWPASLLLFFVFPLFSMPRTQEVPFPCFLTPCSFIRF